MIPDELLKALGLLSLRFNELEDVLSVVLESLIGASNERIAYRFFSPMDFSVKRTSIVRLCSLHETENGPLAGKKCLIMARDWAEKCDSAARTRNLYLHAVSAFHVQDGKV